MTLDGFKVQEVISKLKEEAISMNSNIANLPDLLNLLHTYVDTNLETSTLLKVGRNLLMRIVMKSNHYGFYKYGSFENKRYDGVGEVFSIIKKRLQSFYKTFSSIRQTEEQ